jgi:diguanylate cyclase (GGDEF)-like protein/PAS domain S-box-containing protein
VPDDQSSDTPPADPAGSPAVDLEAVLDASPRVTMVIDTTGIIRWSNAAGAALVGVPLAELRGRNVIEFVVEEDVPLVVESIAYLLSTTGQFRPMEFRYRRADGTVGVVEAVSTNRLDDPAIRGIVVQVHDITERRLIDEILEVIAGGGGFEVTLRQLAHLLEVQLRDVRAIVGVDPHRGRFGTAASANDILDELSEVVAPAPIDQIDTPGAGGSGEAAPEAAGLPWTEAIRTGEAVIHDDLESLEPSLRDEARALGFRACWVFPVPPPGTGEVRACLIAWRTREGPPSPGEQVAADRNGRLLSLALERRRSEDMLLHAARHDPLTGLPNRSQFFRHLGRELRREGHLVAVLYLDLDGFKPINDRYGHRAGDHVLAQIARRIEGVLRPRDLTARLGGDEFGVLCSQLRDEAEAITIAERLIAAVGEPLVLPVDAIRSPELAALAGSPVIDITDRFEPVIVSVTVSVGIAFGHQSGSDDERLVELADAAMYQAKAAGRGSWFRSAGATGQPLGATLDPS